MPRKKRRKLSYDTGSDKFIHTLARRTDRVGDSETLRMLQNRIANKTMAIYLGDRNEQARIIRTFEDTLESLEPGSAEFDSLQRALDNYRKTHVEDYTLLKDVSGKVRTTREAKEVLRRLNMHSTDKSVERMRSNYDTALRNTGHDDLANKLQNLSNDEFMLAYYANPSAEVGYLYNIATDFSPLDDAWERAFELFGFQGMRTEDYDAPEEDWYNGYEYDYLFEEEW